MSEQSTRRVLWWARSFGRPLQSEFAPSPSETQDNVPDEFNELLEMADKRIGSARENGN